jgi:dihydrofolate reductase
MISLIWAMNNRRVIGIDGEMPWGTLPVDMNWFKECTMGKTVVMGRVTFESLKSTPLKGRRNIVLSKDKLFNPKGVEVINTKRRLMKLVREKTEIMIIGGQSLYTLMLPLASKLYVTTVDNNYTGDRKFPRIKGNKWGGEWVAFFAANESNKYNCEMGVYHRLNK